MESMNRPLRGGDSPNNRILLCFLVYGEWNALLVKCHGQCQTGDASSYQPYRQLAISTDHERGSDVPTMATWNS